MISNVKISNRKAIVIDENGKMRGSRCLMENERLTGYTSTTFTTNENGRIRVFDENASLKNVYHCSWLRSINYFVFVFVFVWIAKS